MSEECVGFLEESFRAFFVAFVAMSLFLLIFAFVGVFLVRLGVFF